MLKIEELQKSKLVEIGWRFGQSYYGGYVGGQMIMSTVANRVRAGWGTWLDVLTNIPKYMAEEEMPELVYPGVWDGGFQKLLHIVDGVFEGSIEDMSKGALYWCNLTKIERSWFKEKIMTPLKEDGSRYHPIVANMNSLTFFR